MTAFFQRGVDLLSGIVMPAFLLFTGLCFAVRYRAFWLFHPIRFCRTLRESTGGETSSFRALTVALAGTLGVGNIAGVATAITAGGAGAVFWMWAGALVAMSVKYAESSLAVRCRQTGADGRHYGGMMYVIRDGLRRVLGEKPALVLGGVFAALCLLNSLLTGTVVQVNAAASVYESVPPLLTGAIFAVLVLIVNLGGGKRLSAVTGILIPLLSAVYLILSSFIILRNIGEVPDVFARIFREAFSLRSVGGGLLGTAMAQSIRYGVTRGIFSNEAGCGTSPTAHAAADAKSAHHQGCYGIFEVFIDTVVLCTATALVILLAGEESASLDGIPLSMAAYGALAGAAARQIIGVSVILFAFATVICQHYYGEIAIGYFTRSRVPVRIYTVLMSAACVAGAVIPAGSVWLAADAIISLMTVINLACLWGTGTRQGCFCKSTP